MYKGLTEAKCPRCIVTKIEPALSDHLRRGWLRFWGPSLLCLRLIYPSNTPLNPPFWPVRDQILFTHQLLLAHSSSNFVHTPASCCSSVIKFRSRTSLSLLIRDQISFTRHRILFTHQLPLAHLPSNFDHMRYSEPLTSSNFVHTSSNFDCMRGKKALESSKFDHVRGKKTRASSKFDHVRGKKALESSNFDHARRSEALASSKSIRTLLIFSRTPRDRPRR